MTIADSDVYLNHTHTHTQMHCCFHCNNGYANTPQCHVTRTLPNLFNYADSPSSLKALLRAGISVLWSGLLSTRHDLAVDVTVLSPGPFKGVKLVSLSYLFQ